MSVVTHMHSLEDKHAKLQFNLNEETSRPSPDFAVIQRIKKQKLAIKEELARIASQADAA